MKHKSLKLARKFIENQGGIVTTKTPVELGLADNCNGTLSRPILIATDEVTLCPECGIHPISKDGVCEFCW